MSAFKFEGNIPITGINAARLQDTDSIKNAFEITGPLIEKILAICQSSNEANKWVELLGKGSPGGVDIKRNTSFTSGAHLQPSVSYKLVLLISHFFIAPESVSFNHSFTSRQKASPLKEYFKTIDYLTRKRIHLILAVIASIQNALSRLITTLRQPCLRDITHRLRLTLL